MRLVHGDCLQEILNFGENSVDFNFTCLPKATDPEIDPEHLFCCLGSVMKPHTTVALMVPNLTVGANLILASKKSRFVFRGERVWEKPQGTGPMTVNYRPLKNHELIFIFQDAPLKSTYNQQMTKGTPYTSYEAREGQTIGAQYGEAVSRHRNNPEGTRYPTTI